MELYFKSIQQPLLILIALFTQFRFPGRPIISHTERLLLNDKTPEFLDSGGDEFNPGPETRLGRSKLLCNKVLLKYKGDRESF